MPDRGAKLPRYLYLKKDIIDKIMSGELKPGSLIHTEQELCSEYGISRFPVRQAMKELVSEGYLRRVRGSGTFVCTELPETIASGRKKLLGLVMESLTAGLCGQIFNGFEKQARKRGYLVVSCCSEGIPDEELNCIDRVIDSGVAGISMFPCNESRIGERLSQLSNQGVYIGVIDRNPGISEIDYVGSDNMGGAYMAVRHLAMQGYRNVVFVTDKSNVSSINERLEGYLRAVGDFGLNSVTNINIGEDLGRYPHPMYRFFLEKLKDELVVLKKHIPVGIFAVNDGIALKCMSILNSEGLNVGSEIGIIGFDNEIACEYAPVPLTSVAQNGLLIGQSAADIAIDKIEGKSNSVYKFIVPTQLVIRNSCREKHSDDYK